jgi:hypothetical protein
MHTRSILVSCVLVAALVVTARPAVAERVNRAFAGKIMLSDKHYPHEAKSLAAFNAKVRKQSKTMFREDKEKKWKIYFAGFLRTPLNDVEYVVKLWELTGRSRQLLVSFDQFTDTRGQAALMSSMTLDRKQVGANKQLMMTLESKGHILASAQFKIVGERERYTGKVDFSDDEAQ